jgi:hypothetical protein
LSGFFDVECWKVQRVMGWLLTDTDGAHREGWAVAIVGGQEEGIGSCGDGRGGELVLLAGGGKAPASMITGWRAACTCGWRGPLWRRAKRAATAKNGGRWVYSIDTDPDDAAWEGVRQEWLDHAQNVDATASAITAVDRAARALDTARAELDAAVACARITGASWEAIGQAAGISRQSAHERWAHADTTSVWTGPH